MSENSEEMTVNTDLRVQRMLEAARKAETEAETEESCISDLRNEVKKWVTTLKPDVLAQYSLHMVGDGERNAHDLSKKIEEAGELLDPDVRESLLQQLEDTRKRITRIGELSLKSERHSRTAEELRDEVKKWVNSIPLHTLLHFASHYIGTGTVFKIYIDQVGNN